MDEVEKRQNPVYVRLANLPATLVFDGGDLVLSKGDRVVVATEAGQCVAKVVGFPSAESMPDLQDIKPVLRVLTEEDEERIQKIRAREREAFRFCLERIVARGLPMKLIRVEQFFDENKITFYFSAEGRVDFRELLRDLVERFRTRIELRQIGRRQETALLGGMGSCGRELCCATFLTNFQRISVKMAKYQNMTLNPTKISGQCGKLKCCLAYEKDSYANLIENLPKPGKKVFLPEGEAIVVSINVINQTFVAKLADRRFIKAHASDVMTEEEYKEYLQNKSSMPEREPVPVQEQEDDDAPMVPLVATQPKPKKRRPRNRGGHRKKRSKGP